MRFMRVAALALLTTDALRVRPTIRMSAQSRRNMLSTTATLGLGAVVAAPPPVVAKGAPPPVAATWTLAGGVEMPTLALNTAGLSADGSELALKEAVAAGFRHVDFHPGIERDGVARALGALDRSALFLTTKIAKSVTCAVFKRLPCGRRQFTLGRR